MKTESWMNWKVALAQKLEGRRRRKSKFKSVWPVQDWPSWRALQSKCKKMASKASRDLSHGELNRTYRLGYSDTSTTNRYNDTTQTLTPTATIPITTARRSTPGTNAAKLFLFFCQFDYLDKKIVEYNFNGENLSGANQVNLVTKFANGQS